jgi:hypothetical protein
VSWASFKILFDRKYFPSAVRKLKQQEFLALVQGGMSVTSYENKFNQLSRFAPGLVEDEAWKADRFEQGLKPEIQMFTTLLNLTKYEDVVDRALSVESQAKKMMSVQFSGAQGKAKEPFKRPTQGGRWDNKDKRQRFGERRPEVCQGCGKNHPTKDCRLTAGKCFPLWPAGSPDQELSPTTADYSRDDEQGQSTSSGASLRHGRERFGSVSKHPARYNDHTSQPSSSSY